MRRPVIESRSSLSPVGRGDSSQADCGDQLACLSASRSRLRFRHSEVVGSVSTAQLACQSSALPPNNYLTVHHLEPVDADLPSFEWCKPAKLPRWALADALHSSFI